VLHLIGKLCYIIRTMNKPTKTQKRLAKAFASPARPTLTSLIRAFNGKHLAMSVAVDHDQCDEGANAYHEESPCPCPTCVKKRNA
jgi:hypothetical protein